MLDHVFSDAIGALRDAFTNAFLERQAFDEHFQSDMLLGDLVWETSYGLPGEGHPPRVVSHITLTWPSWSQANYRAWYTEEVFHESPEIEMEIVFRVQRLAGQPDSSMVTEITPLKSPQISASQLERESITIEITHPTLPAERIDHAIEVTYSGDYELAEETLQDGTSKLLDEHFSTLGGWIASTLVRLGDLQLEFLPADEV